MNDTNRRIALAATVVAIALAIAWVETQGTKSTAPPPPADLPAAEAGFASASDFQGATGWLNTPDGKAVNITSLRGQVVLVDFWTYSCINCLHTLPHLTKLYDTYHPYGLTVIGVHTPEFGFERNAGNVRRAIEEHGIHYPVPQDNDNSIWSAYGNAYWPHHYLVDRYGKIRGDHVGEGAYAETEQQVRDLLSEAGHRDLPPPIETGAGGGGGGASPELYAAHGRSVLGNPEGYRNGENVTYARPAAVQANRIYLVGDWHDGDDAVVSRGNGSILVRFQGAAANVVLDGAYGCLPVTLDGAAVPAGLAGPDLDAGHSCLHVAGADSYDFFAGPNAAHTVEIQAPAGLQLFTFDFTG